MTCAACGTMLAATARFCSECGLRQQPGSMPPRHGAPRSRELRPMTVLFCDVVGSAAMAAGTDPEEIHRGDRALLPRYGRGGRGAWRASRPARRRWRAGLFRLPDRAGERCRVCGARGARHPRRGGGAAAAVGPAPRGAHRHLDRAGRGRRRRRYRRSAQPRHLRRDAEPGRPAAGPGGARHRAAVRQRAAAGRRVVRHPRPRPASDEGLAGPGAGLAGPRRVPQPGPLRRAGGGQRAADARPRARRSTGCWRCGAPPRRGRGGRCWSPARPASASRAWSHNC